MWWNLLMIWHMWTEPAEVRLKKDTTKYCCCLYGFWARLWLQLRNQVEELVGLFMKKQKSEQLVLLLFVPIFVKSFVWSLKISTAQNLAYALIQKSWFFCISCSKSCFCIRKIKLSLAVDRSYTHYPGSSNCGTEVCSFLHLNTLMGDSVRQSHGGGAWLFIHVR